MKVYLSYSAYTYQQAMAEIPLSGEAGAIVHKSIIYRNHT